MPLYRYLSFPSEDKEKQSWVADIFLKHQLFFPSRRLFNDPFDCVVPSLLDTPGVVVKRFAEQFVERKFPNASLEDKLANVSKLISVESLEGLRLDVQKAVDAAGILCLSRPRDDILMWAHYADKHKGLCLEFDGSANCNFFGEAQQVEYVNYRPWPLDEEPERQMARAILTKSTHWAYEQEYRIIRPDRASNLVDFPETLLTGVIFGHLMPDNLRRIVMRWATEGRCRVAFFEARPRIGQFALDIVRIA